MDVDKLEAGRELDALIAEKVMGWKKVDHAGLFYEWRTNDGSFTGWYSGGSESYPEWAPSTDIAVAFEVIERIRQVKRPIEVILNGLGGGEKRDEWCFQILTGSDPSKLFDDRIYSNAETPSLAICRASLKYVLVE